MREIYPHLSEQDFEHNYFHTKFSKTSTPAIFDTYIAKEKLGILLETKQKKLDDEDVENKRSIAHPMGIKIVAIRDGWSGTKETLERLIEVEKTNIDIWQTNHLMNKRLL